MTPYLRKALAVLAILATGVCADEGLWSLGMRMEGDVDLEPGNEYMLGPEIGYSNFDLGAHKLQLKGAFLTNRARQLLHKDIIKQDKYLFSPVWHFGRNNWFDPTVQADLGYMHYDREYRIFSSLNNSSWIAALQLGFALNLFQGEYGLFYHFGYNLITPSSGLVLPGLFGVGLWVML